MNLKNGRIFERIKLANEKDLDVKNTISIISNGDEGIKEHLKSTQEIKHEHKSMLDQFQL